MDNFLNPCCISFQANRLLELALHLERSVISLKMDALRLWNIALDGTACGNLLSMIENTYGYPKTRQSKEEGLYFETVDRDFKENASDAEPAVGLVSKEAAETQEKSSSSLPPKKCQKTSSQGPDKVKLKQATPIIPSTSIGLHQTGVPSHYVSERVGSKETMGSEKQSVYRCMFSGCDYITAQHAQCHTHVHCKHLGVQCRLCPHQSYHSVDIQKHLKIVHRDEEDHWFEPTPELEGDIVEVSSDTLRANIALVKSEPSPVTKEDDNEDDEDDEED